MAELTEQVWQKHRSTESLNRPMNILPVLVVLRDYTAASITGLNNCDTD